ncbi:MAG: cation diffusion facilitator family transporter [Planctomycetota bacterium]
MSSGGSKLAVASALGGNFVITIAKFVGFGLTGSAAMLSEAVHSVADTLNQLLLLIGVTRSGRQPDTTFHYGYKREAHVWALISAVGIFFLGCGVTLYHGIDSLLRSEHHAPTGYTVGIVILLGALVLEGAVFVIALREVRHRAKEAGQPFVAYMRHRADPAVVAVLLEDGVAVLGVIVALSAIALTSLTGAHIWDALGSIVIGLLLGFVAVWLIIRNHRLLVGPAAPAEVRHKVREVLDKSGSVKKVMLMRSRMIDPETMDFEVQVEFDGAAIAKRLDPKLEEAWKGIQSLADFKAFAAAFSQDVVLAIGDEIDDLESRIRERVPEAKFLDIEPA